MWEEGDGEEALNGSHLVGAPYDHGADEDSEGGGGGGRGGGSLSQEEEGMGAQARQRLEAFSPGLRKWTGFAGAEPEGLVGSDESESDEQEEEEESGTVLVSPEVGSLCSFVFSPFDGAVGASLRLIFSDCFPCPLPPTWRKTQKPRVLRVSPEQQQARLTADRQRLNVVFFVCVSRLQRAIAPPSFLSYLLLPLRVFFWILFFVRPAV